MKISLNSMSVSSRTALTLFLILLWYGYMLAVLNTRLSVGLTTESIADHYANHSLTKGETKDIEQKGFSEEEVDLDSGKGNDSSMNQGTQRDIKISRSVGVYPQRTSGINPDATIARNDMPKGSSDEHDHHADHEPNYTKEGNGTITPQEIVQLGHIHILGFSLLFISLGIILSLSQIRELWKVIILLILFLSFALDIGGLLLVRFVSPGLAILTVISGIGTGICMAVISLVAMYDMWVRKQPV